MDDLINKIKLATQRPQGRPSDFIRLDEASWNTIIEALEEKRDKENLKSSATK
jgi:hypothetical protein